MPDPCRFAYLSQPLLLSQANNITRVWGRHRSGINQPWANASFGLHNLTATDLQRAASEQIHHLHQQLLSRADDDVDTSPAGQHDHGADTNAEDAGLDTIHQLNQHVQQLNTSASAVASVRPWLQQLLSKGANRLQRHQQQQEQHHDQQEQHLQQPDAGLSIMPSGGVASKEVLPASLTPTAGPSSVQVQDDAFGTLMQWLHAKMLQQHQDHGKRHFKVHSRHSSTNDAHQS